jgi:exodeoxyribonuclease V alpha subunit
MIQSNDHALQLYNGDIGICLDPNGETVVFPGGDFKDEENESNAAYRSIPTRILPENSLVYAMTVHKSQGSEYEACMLVVPEPNENQKSLLTREILYTAITRAKKAFYLFCGEEELRRMIETKTERVSNLFRGSSTKEEIQP